MRELRHITKKQLKKRPFNKGLIIAVVLACILILIGGFAFLRTKSGHVSVDISPGNIYTGSKEQKQEKPPDEDSNTIAVESAKEESEKTDDFTFYKVLNSKEGETLPLKVDASKADYSAPLPEKEPYAEPPHIENMKKIDGDIVKKIESKKIESKDKEGIIYTVQIGALSQEKAANELSGSLRAKGFAPYVSKETSSGRSAVYKVRIGKFLSMVDAQDVAAVLKKEGYATYILKINVDE